MSDIRDKPACPHPDFIWHLTGCNEDGWRCANCNVKAPGEPPGYRPDLDRSEIGSKVETIVMSMHESDMIYCSNSDHGYSVIGMVVKSCKASGKYDQNSIIRFITNLFDDSARWSKLAKDVMGGKDKRERCCEAGCNKLATSWCDGKRRCSDHGIGLLFESLRADPETDTTVDPWEAYGNWANAWREAHPEDERSDLELIDIYAKEGSP